MHVVDPIDSVCLINLVYLVPLIYLSVIVHIVFAVDLETIDICTESFVDFHNCGSRKSVYQSLARIYIC